MLVHSVCIKDFLSIAELKFEFDTGLHLFTGTNGVGKSSILHAVSVCLFNKTERAQPWARIGGDGGFTLEVTFTSVDGTNIKVVNDRSNGRYEVYEDKELLTHQISKGLPLVSSKLNLSYHEFTMLTFLTPNSITDILTGTDSSLISKFFNLANLEIYEKKLLEARRVLNKDNKLLNIKIMDSLEDLRDYDIDGIKARISEVKLNKGIELSSSIVVNVLPDKYSKLQELNSSLLNATNELRDATRALSQLEGIESECPTCGRAIESTSTHVAAIVEYRGKIPRLSRSVSALQDNVDSMYENIELLTTKHNHTIDKFERELRKLESELVAAEIITSKGSVDTASIQETVTSNKVKISDLTHTIGVIRSGKVHEAYLETFVAVLNSTLAELVTSLDGSLHVSAKISNKGLYFDIVDNGMSKTAGVLSAGESVIVGLLVLSAMFSTLETTLGIKISLVMLDEAISAVSKENMEVVSSLLSKLATDRCIIVTQHHDELEAGLFRYTHTVTKDLTGTKINTILGGGFNDIG